MLIHGEDWANHIIYIDEDPFWLDDLGKYQIVEALLAAHVSLQSIIDLTNPHSMNWKVKYEGGR